MAVFLLGGCDLEMCAIKKLLKKYNQKFVDKNLKWGAKLSDYKEELEKYKDEAIYAVELEPDIEVPSNVELIDHHNDFSDRPSSLEQIAKLLNHKLSKFEKAVGANDKGYISAMEKECFSLNNIKRIRKLDRKCQGVTKEEEEAAKKVNLNDRIIEFNYEHFSPLTDRIYFEKGWRRYIIFNDKMTMFYGFEIDELKNFLKEKGIEIGFFGGGERGYLGVLKKVDKKILEEVIDKYDTSISSHTFMLPFVIKNFESFKKRLEQNENWIKPKFNLKREYYNEVVYFYPHIRDVLYGFDENLSVYYEYDLKKDAKSEYIIKIKNDNCYTLEIEDISLRIFNESIGILSFHLNNNDYDYENDILKINDFGRRIFPQFLDKFYGVDGTKNAFLANEIEIVLNNKSVVRSDFENFEKKIKNIEIKNISKALIPEFIEYFTGKDIELIIDDRMFVLSVYLDFNEKVINRLRKYENGKYGYIDDDWWYKYVFVDGKSKTCQSKIMCPKLIEKSTYDRWVEWGTLWGISRYSFVGISNWDLMMTHTKTMYYQMMTLLLMYRAMIVHFSNEVQNIVEMINSKDENLKIIKEKSKKIYGKYLQFLNGFYFQEVTPQEQGIELYNKAMEIMGIEKYVRDFDEEISELDNYISMVVEQERNDELDLLTKIATIFVPISFLASIFGMNIGLFDEDKFIKFLIGIVLFVLTLAASVMLFKTKISKYEKRLGLIFAIIVLIGTIVLGVWGVKNNNINCECQLKNVSTTNSVKK